MSSTAFIVSSSEVILSQPSVQTALRNSKFRGDRLSVRVGLTHLGCDVVWWDPLMWGPCEWLVEVPRIYRGPLRLAANWWRGAWDFAWRGIFRPLSRQTRRAPTGDWRVEGGYWSIRRLFARIGRLWLLRCGWNLDWAIFSKITDDAPSLAHPTNPRVMSRWHLSGKSLDYLAGRAGKQFQLVPAVWVDNYPIIINYKRILTANLIFLNIKSWQFLR